METSKEKRTRQYGSRGLGLVADRLAELIHEEQSGAEDVLSDIHALTEMIAFAYGVVKIEYEMCSMVENDDVIEITNKRE
mgnify:CR=1 FL=1